MENLEYIIGKKGVFCLFVFLFVLSVNKKTTLQLELVNSKQMERKWKRELVVPAWHQAGNWY